MFLNNCSFGDKEGEKMEFKILEKRLTVLFVVGILLAAFGLRLAYLLRLETSVPTKTTKEKQSTYLNNLLGCPCSLPR